VKVIVSPIARGELAEIWAWNVEDKGIRRADSYIDFLDKSISALGKNYQRGKKIGVRPDLRYIQIRRRTGGFAHLAVYSVDEEAVNVLHIFHGAQDWENKLAEEQ